MRLLIESASYSRLATIALTHASARVQCTSIQAHMHYLHMYNVLDTAHHDYYSRAAGSYFFACILPATTKKLTGSVELASLRVLYVTPIIKVLCNTLIAIGPYTHSLNFPTRMDRHL